MILQTCNYKSKKGNDWKPGIARCKSPNSNNVLWIIDEDGNKVKEVFDYMLITALFGSCIDTALVCGYK